MEYFFKKYEFPSEQVYRELLQTVDTHSVSHLAELGTWEDSVYRVDALWYKEYPQDWEPYSLQEVEGNGLHSFAGWNFNNTENNGS